MTSVVHSFEARAGGTFRISFDLRPAHNRRQVKHSDRLGPLPVREAVADTEVVQSIQFETDDPAMLGEMTTTYTLSAAGSGTHLVAPHENMPPGSRPADNRTALAM
jgi:hypothetical protein